MKTTGLLTVFCFLPCCSCMMPLLRLYVSCSWRGKTGKPVREPACCGRGHDDASGLGHSLDRGGGGWCGAVETGGGGVAMMEGMEEEGTECAKGRLLPRQRTVEEELAEYEDLLEQVSQPPLICFCVRVYLWYNSSSSSM